MGDFTSEQNSEPSFAHQKLMVEVVHKVEDGVYLAAPFGVFGTAYALQENQLPALERWLAGAYESDASTSFMWLGGIWGAVIGVFVAVQFEFIDHAVAVICAGLLTLLYLLKRRSRDKIIMRSFPFPKARTTSLGIHRAARGMYLLFAASRYHRRLMWLVTAAPTLLFLLIFLASTVGLIEDPSYPRDIFESLILVGIFTVPLLVPQLFIFFVRYRFKKQTGRHLTIENLYLSKMGRLSGAG